MFLNGVGRFITGAVLGGLSASVFAVTIEFKSISSDGLVGNGGDVLTCANAFDGTLLDLYEAQSRYGLTLDQTLETDAIEAVKAQLEKWRSYDPQMVDLLQMEADQFMSQSVFLSGVELADIPDSQHVPIPVGCEVTQAAVQKSAQFPGEPEFSFDGGIWGRLDTRNKAGLILHELLFRKALLVGQTNSLATRFLTGFYFSNSHQSMSQQDYIRYISAAQIFLGSYELDDVNVASCGYKDSTLSCRSRDNQQYQLVSGDILNLRVGDELQFHENHRLAQATLQSFTDLRVHDQNLLVNQLILNPAGLILGVNSRSYYEHSSPWRCNYRGYGQIRWDSQGHLSSIERLQRLCTLGGRARLYANEVAEQEYEDSQRVAATFYPSSPAVIATLGPVQQLQIVGNMSMQRSSVKLALGGLVTYHPNGRIESMLPYSQDVFFDDAGFRHIVLRGERVWMSDSGWYNRHGPE